MRCFFYDLLLLKALAHGVTTAGSKMRADFYFLGGTTALMVVVNTVDHVTFNTGNSGFVFTLLRHKPASFILRNSHSGTRQRKSTR